MAARHLRRRESSVTQAASKTVMTAEPEAARG
jgi:hypothetical protein